MDRLSTRDCTPRPSVIFTFGALLLLTLATSASAGETMAFSGHSAGWVLGTAVDSNDDGQPAAHMTFAGKTGPGGAFDAGRLSELEPFDGVFCGPTNVLLPFLLMEQVFRYNDGSLLHSEMTSGDICVNFLNGSFTYHLEFDIVGGAGRFEGASGSFSDIGTGQSFATRTSSFSGEMSGQIELP